MEAGQIENGGSVDNIIGTSYARGNPATLPAQAAQVENSSPKLDPVAAPSAKKRKVNASNQDSQEKDTPSSVSNCYVFKSRLQEYCQKAGLRTPAYETIKEGPSHEPYFRSTVIVNDVRYDSLPGFFNRKAAEQSAAEVALIALANSTNTEFGIAQHVHETGLCKNLLQEYSQKMNYAIPLYECHKEEKQGRMPMYSCVVEIGGIKYMGASANTKKEAEIKAARTAMLAIKSSASVSEDNNSMYTVIPQKKKPPHPGISTQGPAAAVKPKKVRPKEKKRKMRQGSKNAKGKIRLEAKTDGQAGVGSGVMVVVSPELKVSGEVEFNANGQRESVVDATDNDGSQAKTETSCGLDVNTDGEKEKGGLKVSSEATDSGHVETNAGISSTKIHDETEKTRAPVDGYSKDGESTTMNTNDMI